MSAAAPREIWIGRDDDKLGPHPLDKFTALHADGRLQRDDLIWWDGLAEWIPLDTALVELGLGPITAPTPSAPPPLPPGTPSAADFQRRAASIINITERAPIARQQGAPTPVLFAFVGLIGFAVLAAAGFAFLRSPRVLLPAFGAGSRAVAEALSAAAMYKTAYVEYVMSNDKVPNSLDEIGYGSAPYGALKQVRIESGTLMFELGDGVIALQPYRNANYQIIFRCGFAAPPEGMEPLGTIDSAQATTIASSDLPDGCR